MKMTLSPLKPGLMTAAAAIALTACATFGGVTISRENVAQSYLPEELYVVATGDKELRAVIVGRPFDMPKDAFEAAVLASLEGKNFGPRLNLSTNPQNEDKRKRHVVLAFNPASVQQADELCTRSANAETVENTGGQLTVTGVYCAGDQYITQATARSGAVTGTNSAQFQQLMAQLAIALFPDENPHRRLDESPVPLP